MDFSGIASHLFTLQHLFLHNQPQCPIIRPDRGRAVNQRFMLLCPISPFLMNTHEHISGTIAMKSRKGLVRAAATTSTSDCKETLSEGKSYYTALKSGLTS